MEVGATLIEKQRRWREGADSLHGSTDKEDTDKKSGEAQASIKMCVCGLLAGTHKQAREAEKR